MLAAEEGHGEIVTRLLEAGANVDARDNVRIVLIKFCSVTWNRLSSRLLMLWIY